MDTYVPATGSVGLAYKVNDDGKTCTITGMGACTDTEIIIPEYIGGYNGYKVTAIGSYVFTYCDTLTKIVVPDSVTSIGEWAFAGCAGLTEMVIPEGVTVINDFTFDYCTGLTKIVIPASVTSIGNYAFSGCSRLTEIVIPEALIAIGEYAFSGCSNLSKVSFTDLEAWCKFTFSDSDSNPLCNGADLYLNGELVTEIEIPHAIDTINPYAFYGCKSLVSVTIPDGVTSIGEYAFQGCTGLSKIEISNSVITIGTFAFGYCTNLTEIEIPDSVTIIADYTFFSCTKLTSIKIPDSVTAIGADVFRNCSGLTSIVIPNSVTAVGARAFERCTGLTSIVIPDSVTSIGSSAFSHCDNLTDIYYTGTEKQWNSIAKGTGWDSSTGAYTMHYHYENHDYQAVVTKPTCTTGGYTTYTCECGDTYVAGEVSALGHKPGAAASCEKDQTCTVCGDVLAGKLGHNYVNNTCTRCGTTTAPVKPTTIVLAEFSGYGSPPGANAHNTQGKVPFGQRYNIGDQALKRVTIVQLACYGVSTNTWTFKVWKWNGTYQTTVNSAPIYTTYGINHQDGVDLVIDIPDNVIVTGEFYYEILCTNSTASMTGWTGINPRDGLITYLNGSAYATHYASTIAVVPYEGGAESPDPDTPTDQQKEIILAIGGSDPHNVVGSKSMGQRYNIGETYLKTITITRMATFTDNNNSWTLKIWRWNTDYGTTTSATPLFTTYGMNHMDSTDFVVEIPDTYRIYGDIYYEIQYTRGTMTFTGWADTGTYQKGLESYLSGIKWENHYGASFIVIVPANFDPNPPESDDSGSTTPTDPDVIVLADRAGYTPQTGGGDFFGQRFDLGSSTLKQLVITKLATFTDNVNTWEIKFWQWDTNQPITVKGTPLYTVTGSNHIDTNDFIIDIPDGITLTGVIYYEIYYRSGSTGFAGWDALGSHHDSLHTYINGNEVNTHIASYIRIEPSAEPDEPDTDEPSDGLNIKQEDLKEIMQNVFDGTISLKETVMFIDKNTTKDLLFPINSVISVTSYDGKVTYQEGVDYVVENGKLKITANSTMPAITSNVYYNYAGSLISKDGKNLYWGESMMKQWQVCVTYTHNEGWSGFEQSSYLDVYEDFVQKLVDGEDVTVMFYGDSITWGANSTFAETVQPRQGAYAMLFTEALADLFGYTVKYVNTGLTCHSVQAVPTADYVAGNRGTITYVNTAVGGWTSADGKNNFDQHIKAQYNQYGCDLLVVAFGMNDGNINASTTKSNVKSIIDKMYQLNSKAAVMIVSTMTPHTGTNWDHNNIKNQETQLTSLASAYRSNGKAVAVAQVNSVSVAVQTRKSFNDYAGNNVNHPNDWFYRVYAQTLLQTLIGYENMD